MALSLVAGLVSCSSILAIAVNCTPSSSCDSFHGLYYFSTTSTARAPFASLVEERNITSIAYKCVIGARHASWRIVSSIKHKEESKGNEAYVAMVNSYGESELAKIGEDILDLYNKRLISSAA